MKKMMAVATVVIIMVIGFFWWLTPVTPDHFQLHVVRGGETINSIIINANKDSDIDYDIREAAATAVAESKKMEGGAQGYLIKPGDKVAVPIYRQSHSPAV